MKTRAADVVIIGAGVIGLSIAYHLTKGGCRNVVVVEAEQIGSGATGKCPGGIRQQFSSKINVELSQESSLFFKNFKEETGCDSDFRQKGYLMLATTEDTLQLFRQNIVLQQSLGVNVSLLSPEETRELVPVLNTGDILATSYSPDDGYADPYSVVMGFASAARQLGASILEETPVTGLQVSGGKIEGVVTEKGKIAADVVINAAGAHSGLIGQMVGLSIPVEPMRRHVFFATRLEGLVNNTPMVVDFNSGFWFRQERTGLIFGMRNPAETAGFDISVDWGWLPAIGETAGHFLSSFGDIGIVRAWAGLHSDTPDRNAILGQVPGIDGLILACGLSGHGFMHSPAIGRIMAGKILDKNGAELPFPLERFAQSQPRQAEKSFI